MTWRIAAALMRVMSLLVAALLLAAAPPPRPPPPPPAEGGSLVLLVDTGTLPADQVAPVTAAARHEVETSRNWRWREPPPMSVDELVLALACRKLDQACYRKTVDGLRADAILMVTAPKGAGSAVELHLFQRKKGRSMRTVTAGAPGPQLPAAVAKAARELLGEAKPGSLVLTSDPPGAAVVVGVDPAGVTPVTLDGVPAGSVLVSLELDGYQAFTEEIVVESGKATTVNARLERVPAPQAAPAPGSAPVATAPVPSGQPVLPPDIPEPEPSGAAGLPAMVKLPLVGAGALGLGVAVLAGVVGAALLSGSGAIYALVWNVQSAQSWGNPLVYPLSFLGGGAAGVGLIVVPVALLLIGATVGADMAMGGGL